MDVLDESSIAAAFGMAPPPQAVVNLIGGYTPPQPLSGLDVGVLRKQLELNLVTAAIVTKHAMPLIAAQGGGTIVHVSSRVAAEKGANGFAYSVSKLGVLRLVEAAAAEGRELGVRVNCIMPSIIDTPANRAAMPRADHDRWPKPSELAAVLAFLVSDDAVPHLGSGHPRIRPRLAAETAGSANRGSPQGHRGLPRFLSTPRIPGSCGVPRCGATPRSSGAPPGVRVAWPGGASAACVHNAAAPLLLGCCEFAPSQAVRYTCLTTPLCVHR